jgi:hypothetical protein
MRLDPVWLYVQDTGAIYFNRSFISIGYAGRGIGVNNSDLQNRVGVGPIPRGLWSMGRVQQTPSPHSIRLNPGPETETFGRSGFLVHGGNADTGRTASRGCIILDRTTRKQIMASRGWLSVCHSADETCKGLWEPGQERRVL